MSAIAKFIPTILAGIFKFIKMSRASEAVVDNPKATNGGIVTIILTLICLYVESIGMVVTPELQESLAGVIAGAGIIYTSWKASI